MSPAEPDQLIVAVLGIAREAGGRILDVYGAPFAVETKADDSPLTAADRAAHEIILRRLAALTPRLPIWSEESGEIPFGARRDWPEFWLVDPLDGTREFIKRNGEFTVNIALVRDHSPVLGVVHAPVLDRDYFACRGGHAYRRDGSGASRPIAVRAQVAQPLRVAGSRSHRGASLDRFLDQVGPHELVTMGSSLKFCLVAEGAADIYPRLGPTSEWDTAAAQAIVEAAGGQVVDLEGRPLRYNERPGTENPDFVACGDATRHLLRYLRN